MTHAGNISDSVSFLRVPEVITVVKLAIFYSPFVNSPILLYLNNSSLRLGAKIPNSPASYVY